MARDFQNDDEPPTGAEAALETRVAAFEDCGTLTAASASTGAINLLGGKMRRVRAVCLPASEGVGPRDAMGQAARRWHHRRCVNRWSAPMPQPNDPGLRRGGL